MLDRRVLAVGIATLVSAAGCGTVDPEPLPPAPAMIAFTSDPFDARGIRPDPLVPEAPGRPGAIFVEWERLDAARLGGVTIGGYHLYRADSTDTQGRPGAFRRIATLTTSALTSDTSYSDTSAAVNVRYWYAVRAFTRNSGAEGPMSDTVHFTLTDRPIPVAPIGSLDSASFYPLRFRFGPPVLGGEVAIQLERVHRENDAVVLDTIWRARAFATFSPPEVVYTGPALVPQEQYRWRVDKVFGVQPIGNSSRWISFVAP